MALGLAPLGAAGACADDPLGDLRAPVAARSGGRQRFVVTLAAATPDLGDYRKLLKEDPAAVAGYVEQKRAALTRPDVEAALAGVNARVVERWWMSGQLTVELPPEQVSAVRALPGIAAVVPDVPLQ
ncbi:MAG: hypothetical protein FJ137_02675 [Deltaproteobacteria bacterium]|nr:hypothetical protein [Deltaproteobacteria bacterium]